MFRLLKRVLLLAVVVAATLLAVRAYDAQRGAPLQRWHTYVPHDMRAADIDKADWPTWLRAEEEVFREVRAEVVDKLDPEDRNISNRYYAGSPIYPGKFVHDWNRSYVLEPDGPPVGAVVLLHGLTDAPYSLRHVARRYRDRGFVAVGIRLPGHGTVPAALTGVAWICSADPGSACVTPAGTGNTVDLALDLAVGGTATVTVAGNVADSASSTTVVNTATVAPAPGAVDPVPGNDSATASTVIGPLADLAVTKTGPATVTPGDAVSYTVTVTNNGPATSAVGKPISAPIRIVFPTSAPTCSIASIGPGCGGRNPWETERPETAGMASSSNGVRVSRATA